LCVFHVYGRCHTADCGWVHYIRMAELSALQEEVFRHEIKLAATSSFDVRCHNPPVFVKFAPGDGYSERDAQPGAAPDPQRKIIGGVVEEKPHNGDGAGEWKVKVKKGAKKQNTNHHPRRF